MEARPTPRGAGATPPDGREPISPELVLVDPALRRQALATYEQPWAVRRPALAAAASTRPASRRRIGALLSRAVQPGRVQLGLAAFFGGIVMLVATHPPSFPLFGGEPPSVPISAGLSVEPQPVSAELTSRPTVKVLAWKPVPGVTGYSVAIYQGGSRVLQKETTSASVRLRLQDPSVPADPSARSGGLAPGTYDWYVWPVRAGHRGKVAIVRSKLFLAVG